MMVIGLSAGSLIRSVIIRVINKIKSDLFNREYMITRVGEQR